MRLTIEEHPESVRRYAHVPRARRFDAEACRAPFHGASRSCTLTKGHRGPHIAHGRFGRVLAVWRELPRTAVRQTRPSVRAEVRPRAHMSMLRALRGLTRPSSRREGRGRLRLERLLASVDTIIFFTMFVAFVGFGLYWTSLILR